MTRTAPRRPTTRRPAEVPLPTLQMLPRPNSWLRDSTVCVAAGMCAFGAAPLTGHPDLAFPGLMLGLSAGLARGAHGARAKSRGELADRLAEALAPQLGLRGPDRRAVKLDRWSRGWPGAPRRVHLRYAPGIDDTDPAWRSEIVKAASRRLLADYKLTGHDRRRCRIRLEWLPPTAEPAIPVVQARAERTVLELLGPTAAVTKFSWSGEALIAIDVRHEAGAKLASAQHRHRIERVVSTMLPGRWRALWKLEEDTVRFEVRPTLPALVEHPPAVVTPATLDRLPLAVGEDGEILEWNLRGQGPHLMVVGRTGTGKTVVINGVVMEAAARGIPVWICDPKRIEFMGLRRWPNVQVVATTVEHMVALIYRAWDEMERRYALVEAGQADEGDFTPLILVLDEYRDLVGMINEWYARIKVRGMPSRCSAFEKFTSLARRGRSARVHLILGTQRPDADILAGGGSGGGELRDNFATRISLGRLSPQGAQMMWDASYIGVTIPRGIPGRGTAVSAGDDRPMEVQSYWTPDPRRAAKVGTREDLAILSRLRPTTVKHPALQVQLPEELLHPSDDDGNPLPALMWEAVMVAEFVPAMEPAEEEPLSPADLLAGRPLNRLALPAPRLSERRQVAVEEPHLVDDIDDDADYDPPADVRADQLREGDLVLVEEATALWAVVESAERDVDEVNLVLVDWRSDSDEAGTLAVSDDELVSVRRPREAGE